MILDFRADASANRRYSILDADTGENINHENIFYADDETGIYKVYVKNDKGQFVADESGIHLKTEQRQRNLRFVSMLNLMDDMRRADDLVASFFQRSAPDRAV